MLEQWIKVLAANEGVGIDIGWPFIIVKVYCEPTLADITNENAKGYKNMQSKKTMLHHYVIENLFPVTQALRV